MKLMIDIEKERQLVISDIKMCMETREANNKQPKDNDLCKTCKKGDVCKFSTKIFSNLFTTECNKNEKDGGNKQ